MSAREPTEPLARLAMALACVPVLGLVAVPVAVVARRRATRDLRPGAGLATGAIALAVALAFVAGLVAVQLSGGPDRDESGQVAVEQEVDLLDLRTGDCLSSLPQGDEDQALRVIPCEQAHLGEVFATTDLTMKDYPGQEVVESAMNRACGDALEDYVGAEPDGLVLDGYYPYATDWSYGERGIICIVEREDGAPLTGSLRDSGGISS